MKNNNIKLEWYALLYDSNYGKMMKFNIFNEDIIKNIYKEIKNKKINSKIDLFNYIDKWAKYSYSSRTEYEYLIGSLFDTIHEQEKLNVYNQIEPNLGIITEYIINKLNIKF